jgi:hypothetical protein
MSLLSALALEHCHNPACRYRTARTRLSPSRGIVLNGDWFCGAACFEAGVAGRCGAFIGEALPPKPAKPHRVPLGLLLMSRGHLDLSTLRQALERQEAVGGRIGDVLRSMGAVTEQQITSAVAAQWSCPVFALRDHPGALQYARQLPLGLLERYRALPVHFSPVTRVLHVAFAQEVSSTLLYAAQQMLTCSTEACIADESAIMAALEKARQIPDRSEFLLARLGSAAEMARIAVGYAQKLGASGARLLPCDDYLWLRLLRRDTASDFLFQLSTAAMSGGEYQAIDA